MTLEEICKLEPENSDLLHADDNGRDTIEVRQWQQYRWLHIGDRSIQTLMNTNNIGRILLPNIQALLATLLFCPKPEQLLNLGLGGASLERYLSVYLPQTKVTAVEENKQIIAIAKEFFYIPEQVNVKHDRAENFIQNQTQVYDIILCDVFIADKQASCLYKASFYAHIANCIEDDGVLAINILPQSDDDIVSVLLASKNDFSYIHLLEFDEFSNVILFLSRTKFPPRNQLIKRAETLFKNTQLDLRDIPMQLEVLLETV